MKTILTTALAMFVCSAAYAQEFWSEDFRTTNSPSFPIIYDPIPTNEPWADGDVYPDRVGTPELDGLPYGRFGALNYQTVQLWQTNGTSNTNGMLALKGHNNDSGSGRSSVIRFEGSDFGSTTDMIWEYDIKTLGYGDTNTYLVTTIWEAKVGGTPGATNTGVDYFPYYMDCVLAPGVEPNVNSWHDPTNGVYFLKLAGGTNLWSTNYNVPELDLQLPFTRVDTTADLVVFMMGVNKAWGEFGSVVEIDRVSLLAAPVGPTLSISAAGGTVTVEWTPVSGTLQSAPAVSGPWSPVTTNSPYMTPVTGSGTYYRVED